MAEEVKIVIRQETQGTAVRDAERDLDRLNRSGGKVDWAGLQRQREEAARALSGKGPAANPDAGKSQSAITREIALSTELEAAQERLAGNSGRAAQLEREAEVLRRSVGIQQQLNVTASEAKGFAETQLAAEEKIVAEKQAAAAASKAEAAAASAAAKAQREEIAAEARARKEAVAEAAKAERAAIAEATAARKAAAAEEALLRRQAKAESAALTKELNAIDAEAAAAKRASDREARGLGGAVGRGAGIGGLARGVLNPEFLIAAAVTAGIGAIVSEAVDRRDARAAAEGRSGESAARRNIIRGHTGEEGQEEASANLQRNRSELEAALEKRGNFRDSGKGDMIRKALGLETSGQKGERENNLEIERLQREKPLDEKLAQDKFKEGPGGDELQQQERLAQGDRRGAHALQLRVEWQKEYQRVLKETRDEATAQESASLKVFNSERSRREQAASRLVNARSGAGDIARASQLAGGSGISADIAKEIAGLHETVKVNHREALNATPRRRF